jgi:Uma2 family endonuclease
MSVLPKHPQCATVADLLAIPEEQRHHEIVDGELVEKAIASGRHGGAQVKLGAKLEPYHRRAGRGGPGGWWFASEAMVLFEEQQVFRPDVSGWRRERLAALTTDPIIRVIPDWICEILSPSNASHDTVKKKRTYHRHRVGHYWVIDPMNETLTVYRFTPEAYLEILTAARGERVRPEPFDAIDLPVGVLFGDEEEE